MKDKADRLIDLFSLLIEYSYADEKSSCKNTPLCTLNSNDLKVLLALSSKNHPGIKEISEELQLPMSTLTGIFNKLVDKDLVERDRCEEDRRVVRVHLSRRGIDAAEQKKSNTQSFAENILAKLTETEQEQFLSLLEKITKTSN